MPNPNHPQHQDHSQVSATSEAPMDHSIDKDPQKEAESISLTPPSTDQKKTKNPGSRKSGSSVAGTLVLCMFILVLVMGYFLHTRIAALESQRTELIDSVLIIDYQSLFAGLPEDITGEQANEVFNRVHERILALQDAGYIVLDSNAVLAAPSELRLDGTLLLEGGL